MPEEQEIRCPLCGKNVPPDADKCPFCSTQVETLRVRRDLERVIERRVMRRVLKAQKEEVQTAEVPNAPIPEVKIFCPGCSMELAGIEVKCPRCGVPLSTEPHPPIEPVMTECQKCGAKMPAGAAACANCGAESAESEEPLIDVPEPEAEVVAPPSEDHEPAFADESIGAVTAMPSEISPSSRGLTNGQSAINGTGLVNGTGMVNGTGLVNGTGMINGNKVDMRMPPPSRSRSRGIARWQFIAVLVALLIIIPTFIYISYAKDLGDYVIDGEFGDWDDSELYSIATIDTAPLTLIDDWSVGIAGTRVFFYVSASNDIMTTSAVESIFLFVDTDGDDETGYMVEGIGAEYYLEVDGWNDSIQSSSLCHYEASSDRYDWSSWTSQGSISHRLNGHQLEAGVDLQVTISMDACFVLYSQDSLERSMVSNPIPRSGGVLVISQSLSSLAPLSGILQNSESAALLELTFECDGADGVIDEVVPSFVGVSGATQTIAPFSLDAGDSKTVQVYVNTLSLSEGDFVSAVLSPDGVTSSFSKVIVKGQGAKAYVGASPSVVYIDGAFGDWIGRTASDVDEIPMTNANIDVTQVGIFNTTASSSFFIEVDGEMCAGAYVPALRGKATSGGDGNPVIPAERRTGEDILRIYIDSDLSSSTGYLMSVESKIIGADYMIEVRGLFGEITSKALYRFMSNSWSTASATVNAAIDDQRMEVGVLASTIDGSSGLDFIVETTDWNDRQDIVGLDSATLQSLTGGIALTAGTKSWVVQSSIGDSATAMSYQRKLFYDGTNFWSLYWDGSNTVYEYSSDGGQTWNNLGSVFTRTLMGEVSLWYDGANQLVYVVGDDQSSSTNIYAKRGSVNPASHTITWGSDATISGISTEAYANKNTYISKDSNGYIWVVSVSLVQTNPSNKYNARVMQANAVDSLTGGWTARGNIIGGSGTSSSEIMASILPGKSGSGIIVWVIYSYDGIVESRTHDGSTLSSSTTIYAAGASTLNTVNSPPSAVIDSNGIVHVVYGSGNMYGGVWKGHILYSYNLSSNSWSSPLTLNSTSTYVHRSPTISLDSTTGNLYAMWLEDTTNQVQIKKNVSGTWSFVTISQTAYTKYYLTSIYSAPGETYICCQWTQDTSGTYEVVFEKIPEFSEVVIPVFFMMMVFVVMYRGRVRRSREDK